MKILHLDLKPVGNDYAEFRYFWDNPNDYQSHQLPLAEITDLIKQAETDYYTRLPEDYAKTGQTLYNWLDGSSRIFQRAIDLHRRESFVLAIAASQRLAHLPWEVLHDGQGYLVKRQPAIIPVRWVKDESERQLTIEEQPANRALNLLFMATSPQGIKPELDFEVEEAQIWQATKRTPLYFQVEESGCLTELGYLINEYPSRKFDVVHLTGHATIQNDSPCFITETEYGEPQYSNAEEIADALQEPMPKLIFLSGCRTGYSSDDGAVPSMAEALLNQGATAVLGWGQKVKDSDATKAATKLYQKLSAGKTVAEAVSSTYQALIECKARDWHLLRLYVAETIPGALVTPLRTPRRKPVPRHSTTEEFRNPQGKLRVATRESFVGRRRQLQNCLRTLKVDYEKVGVLIHGMKGLGKSTIASRLGERLPEYEKVLWQQQIDTSSLVNRLADKLRNSEQRTALKGSQEELKYRLRNLFWELNEAGEKPFLFVLDDFEWNLEPRQKRYILKTGVAEVLEALVWAIQSAGLRHRIIITCCHDFESNLLNSFYKELLEPFCKSELQKKLNRLEAFNSEKLDEALIEKALQLVDGNPLLLECLIDEVLSKENAESRLGELEANLEEWKRRIIGGKLYEQIDLILSSERERTKLTPPDRMSSNLPHERTLPSKATGQRKVLIANRTEVLQLVEQMVKQQVPFILLIESRSGFGKTKMLEKLNQIFSSEPDMYCIPVSLKVAASQSKNHLLDTVRLRLKDSPFPHLNKAEENYWKIRKEIGKFNREQIDQDDYINIYHRDRLDHAWREVIKALFQDLQQFNQQIVILFDDFDSAPSESKTWIGSIFIPHASNTPRLLVVIAGESVPKATIEWNCDYERILLREIKDTEEWYKYSQDNAWFLSRDDVSKAVKMGKGHPKLVVEFLQLFVEEGRQGVDEQ